MKLMILAGEVSGDIHASHLVSEIKKLDPSVSFMGMGGELLEKEGVHLFYQLKDLAVLGLSEVLRKYFHFLRIFRHLAKVLEQEKPDALILVDYPGFNVRFAKVAKKLKIPVIYYISPQIWAWAKWRRHIIAKRVDKMLVVFPFEKNVYEGTPLDVDFVGHPLLDKLKESSFKEGPSLLDKEGEEKIVGLLPGSRLHEVSRLFPLMLDVAEEISKQEKKVRYVASAAEEKMIPWMTQEIQNRNISIDILKGNATWIMRKADFGLVASGTATLESALFKFPMVILYKVSFLTWCIGKMVIKLPYIGLVNVVLGDRVVPEFIQYEIKTEKIANEVLGFLRSPAKITDLKNKLGQVEHLLGDSGASRKAALAVQQFLREGVEGSRPLD